VSEVCIEYTWDPERTGNEDFPPSKVHIIDPDGGILCSHAYYNNEWFTSNSVPDGREVCKHCAKISEHNPPVKKTEATKSDYGRGLDYGYELGRAIGYLDARCKSPIEAQMAYALVNVINQRDLLFHITIDGQTPIGKYTADFAFGKKGNEKIYAILECDGHDYHERTKEQAAHDRQRDRAIQALGIMVIRFTGSEIHKDADKCANEAINMILNLIPLKAKAA
jgi:very-short-patch-repair endonuclease